MNGEILEAKSVIFQVQSSSFFTICCFSSFIRAFRFSCSISIRCFSKCCMARGSGSVIRKFVFNYGCSCVWSCDISRRSNTFRAMLRTQLTKLYGMSVSTEVFVFIIYGNVLGSIEKRRGFSLIAGLLDGRSWLNRRMLDDRNSAMSVPWQYVPPVVQSKIFLTMKSLSF